MDKHLKNSSPVTIALPSGLRCVCVQLKDTRVEYFGVVVNAGSRDDPQESFGLAHFVEHTLFKGTDRRRSWHIINRMESCGGELNAYTTKETTTVYSVFPVGNLRRAADLISDLVVNSRFPQHELDKEREVVTDEISSYLDVPSEAVYDDFEDLLFVGTTLGHNILGTRDALARFSPELCRSYLARLYVASNMVVFYSGPEAPDRVARVVERYFWSVPDGNVAVDGRKDSFSEIPTFDERRPMGIHQAHTIVGARVCDMFSDERFALSLLVNILGGPGMNSLLNVELRERRGLVYSVDASVSLLKDVGVFAIYFGCDPEDLSCCRRIVERVIGDICDRPLSDRRFAQAVRQYVGQLDVAADNRENSILSMARSVLYRGEAVPLDRVAEHVRSLTPHDLMQAAAMIAPERLSALTFY